MTPRPTDADYHRFHAILRGDEKPESTEYLEGYDASLAGKKCWDKPGGQTAVQAASWHIGWDDAKRSAE